MTPFGSNVSKCHKCPLRDGGNCSVDRDDIIAHARAGECPHPDGPRFTEAAPATSAPQSPREPPVPVPREKWPKWVKLVAKRQKPGDVGVGDTLARVFAGVGGEQYKRLRKWLGMPCSCEREQARLNVLYAY